MWTVYEFKKRLDRFLKENPGLTRNEACSILGKRGNFSRRNNKGNNKKIITETPARVINVNINIYVNESHNPNPVQLELF